MSWTPPHINTCNKYIITLNGHVDHNFSTSPPTVTENCWVSLFMASLVPEDVSQNLDSPQERVRTSASLHKTLSSARGRCFVYRCIPCAQTLCQGLAHSRGPIIISWINTYCPQEKSVGLHPTAPVPYFLLRLLPLKTPHNQKERIIYLQLGTLFFSRSSFSQFFIKIWPITVKCTLFNVQFCKFWQKSCGHRHHNKDTEQFHVL